MAAQLATALHLLIALAVTFQVGCLVRVAAPIVRDRLRARA